MLDCVFNQDIHVHSINNTPHVIVAVDSTANLSSLNQIWNVALCQAPPLRFHPVRIGHRRTDAEVVFRSRFCVCGAAAAGSTYTHRCRGPMARVH